jgi:hypothetical protein
MVPATPIETNGRRFKVPGVYGIIICFNVCEPAHFVAAIEHGLMPNLNHIRQSGSSAIANSVIPYPTNPNKSDIDRVALQRDSIHMAVRLGGGVARGLNKLRESPAMAYRT